MIFYSKHNYRLLALDQILDIILRNIYEAFQHINDSSITTSKSTTSPKTINNTLIP